MYFWVTGVENPSPQLHFVYWYNLPGSLVCKALQPVLQCNLLTLTSISTCIVHKNASVLMRSIPKTQRSKLLSFSLLIYRLSSEDSIARQLGHARSRDHVQVSNNGLDPWMLISSSLFPSRKWLCFRSEWWYYLNMRVWYETMTNYDLGTSGKVGHRQDATPESTQSSHWSHGLKWVIDLPPWLYEALRRIQSWIDLEHGSVLN